MTKISIFSLTVLLFFSVSLNPYPLTVFTILSLSIVTMLIKNYSVNLKMEYTFLSWVILFFLIIVNIILNDKNISSLLYLALMIIFIFIFYLMMNDRELMEWTKKIFYGFSGIHIICVLMQSIFPNYILMINKLILPLNSYLVNYSQSIRGMYAGVTGQVGAAAFYVTILIAFFSVKLLTGTSIKNRVFYILGLFLSYYALLMTTKRALLLFNIIIIFMLIILRTLIKKNLIENLAIFFVGSVLLISGVAIALNIIPIGNIFNEDISSGRISLYIETLKISGNNIVTGVGFGNIELIMGEKSHNIYLQFLAEMGIFILPVFILVLLIPMVMILKKIIMLEKNSYENSNQLKFNLYLSLYMQLIFVLYGFLGNPLYDYFMLGIYMFFVAFGLNIKNEINEVKRNEKNWSTYIS